MPVDLVGMDGKIADALNDILDLNDKMANALDRISRSVGKEGKIAQRASIGAASGGWAACIDSVNSLIGDLVQPFDDAKPSIPVGFTSSRWGSLASFGARAYKGTKKIYGTSGNSFVAVVEFGDSVRAIAVTAGGESGHPASPHFNDEAERYATGNLREVYFYPSQLKGHTERQYHPGE